MSTKKSIVTEYTDISAFSGAPAQCSHHLVYGRGLRELADEDFLILPLTHAEHNASPYGNLYQIHGNPVAEKLSKMLGQACFETNYLAEQLTKPVNVQQTNQMWREEARQAFMKRYGISYL